MSQYSTIALHSSLATEQDSDSIKTNKQQQQQKVNKLRAREVRVLSVSVTEGTQEQRHSNNNEPPQSTSLGSKYCFPQLFGEMDSSNVRAGKVPCKPETSYFSRKHTSTPPPKNTYMLWGHVKRNKPSWAQWLTSIIPGL